MKKGLLTIICFFFLSGVFGQNSKKALSLLEKKDFIKVEQLFRKSIEKDSINPGSYYVHSRLFLSESFPKYDLDSSYLLILKAIDHYALIDQKELERLNKIQINDSSLWAQKKMIDSMAFQLALKSNQTSDYNLFLNKHPTAAQVNEATLLRNKVAYEKAKSINTYQAFKDFFDTYPQASEAKEANARYNQLLFEEKTKEKSLGSYRKFLEDHPSTPFRNILEKGIFEMSTADNKEMSYLAFIDQYPDSKYAKKAIDYLFYHQRENGSTTQDFLERYEGKTKVDSIRKIAPFLGRTLFPIYEKTQYKFIDHSGELVKTLTSGIEIDESYYCSGAIEDFLIAKDKDTGYILTKSGERIYKGPFETITSLGYGLLKITRRGNHGVIHKAGWEVLPMSWDDIELIADQFLVTQKKGLFGLSTLSGQTIFSPEFQDIQVEGDFLIFEKNGKFALSNCDELVNMLATNRVKLQFKYDDYQLINDHLMIIIKNNQEGLINNRLVDVIPLEIQKVQDQPHGWYVIKSDSFIVYNQQLQKLFADRFDQYQFKDAWYGLKQNDKWALFNTFQQVKKGFEFDSIQFLNNNAVFLVSEEERSILLVNGSEIKIKENQRFRVMSPNLSENKHDSLGYLVISDPRKRLTTLYNMQGEKIRALTNTEVNTLYNDFFIIEKNGKKGLMDSNGKVVLGTYYDAIGKPKNGIFSLLQRNRFGSFREKDGFSIRPEYESMPLTYNQTLLVARKSSKSGFIDHNNKKITGFIFEKIQYWSDSLAVVFKEGYWGVYDIYKNEYILENLTDLQIFADSSETKAIILGEKGYGVIGNVSGTIIKPTFDDLQVIGEKDTYLFFCEKHVKEADLFVVVYMDKNGKTVRRQIYEDVDYDKIYCDN